MIKQKVIKIISFVVLLTFSYTFILHDMLYGISVVLDESKIDEVVSKFDKFILPYRLGRVVDMYDSGGDILLVLIQDLHCHPEVQKNIFEIIKMLDEKFKVEKIFVEGAPKGKVEPTVFDTIPDETLKKIMVGELLNKGLIGGAEYYEILYRKNKLYGMEDWEVYVKNYERLKKILINKVQDLKNLEVFMSKINTLKKNRLSKNIKKLEKAISNRESFYNEIKKYLAREVGGLNLFPEIKKYIELRKIAKHIKLKSLNYELKKYINELQEILPYSVYSTLIQKLQHNASQDEYYIALALISSEYPEIVAKYPSLNKFFEYVKLNCTLNPAVLVAEEKIIKMHVLSSKADNLLDTEILFLSLMSELLKNLIEFKITPTEYEYFKKNKTKFEKLLFKYFDEFDVQNIISLIKNSDIFEFYDTNINRNKILYNNIIEEITRSLKIEGKKIEGKNKNNIVKKDFLFNLQIDAMDPRLIYLVITGGFHTGITEFLKQEGISYVVLMPNVTHSNIEKLYEQMILGQIDFSKILLNSAFAPMLLSVGLTEDSVEGLVLGLFIYGILHGMDREKLNVLFREWKNNLVKSRKDVAQQISNLDIKVLDEKTLAIGPNTYQVIIEERGGKKFVKEIKRIEESPKLEKISVLNRVITGTILFSIPVILASAFSLTLPGYILGAVIGASLSARYFTHLFYFIKAGLELGPPQIIYSKFKTDADVLEAPLDTPWYTIAYVRDNKIYVNFQVLRFLPISVQKAIYQHEKLHLRMSSKIKNTFLREIVVTLAELLPFRFRSLMTPEEIKFIRQATEKAKEAKKEKGRKIWFANVGCVVVMDGEVITAAYNTPTKNVLHAEQNALISVARSLINDYFEEHERNDLLKRLDELAERASAPEVFLKEDAYDEYFRYLAEELEKIFSRIKEKKKDLELELYISLEPCKKCFYIIQRLGKIGVIRKVRFAAYHSGITDREVSEWVDYAGGEFNIWSLHPIFYFLNTGLYKFLRKTFIGKILKLKEYFQIQREYWEQKGENQERRLAIQQPAVSGILPKTLFRTRGKVPTTREIQKAIPDEILFVFYQWCKTDAKDYLVKIGVQEDKIDTLTYEEFKEKFYASNNELTLSVISIFSGWGHILQGGALINALRALGVGWVYALDMLEVIPEAAKFWLWLAEVYNLSQKNLVRLALGLPLQEAPKAPQPKSLIQKIIVALGSLVIAIQLRAASPEKILERPPTFPTVVASIFNSANVNLMERMFGEAVQEARNNLPEDVQGVATTHPYPARILAALNELQSKITNVSPDPAFWRSGTTVMLLMNALVNGVLNLAADDEGINEGLRQLGSVAAGRVLPVGIGTIVDPIALYIGRAYAIWQRTIGKFSLTNKYSGKERRIVLTTSGNRAHMDQIAAYLRELSEYLKTGTSPAGFKYKIFVFIGDHGYSTEAQVVYQTLVETGLAKLVRQTEDGKIRPEDIEIVCPNLILIDNTITFEKIRNILKEISNSTGVEIPYDGYIDLGTLKYIISAYCHMEIGKPGENPMTVAPMGTDFAMWPGYSYHENINGEFARENWNSATFAPVFKFKEGKVFIRKGYDEKGRPLEEEIPLSEFSLIRWFDEQFVVRSDGVSYSQKRAENGYNNAPYAAVWVAALTTILRAQGFTDNIRLEKLARMLRMRLPLNRELMEQQTNAYDNPWIDRRVPPSKYTDLRVQSVETAISKLKGNVPSVIFLDIDGTIAPHGEDISEEMAGMLKQISEETQVVIVTGRPIEPILRLPNLSRFVLQSQSYLLTKQGLEIYKGDKKVAGYYLSRKDRSKIKRTVNKVLSRRNFVSKIQLTLDTPDNNLIYTVVDETLTEEDVLPIFEEIQSEIGKDFDVSIAKGFDRNRGKYVLEIIVAKRNKAEQIREFLKTTKFSGTMLYVGDSFYASGNDTPILSLLSPINEMYAIRTPGMEKTYEVLKEIFKKMRTSQSHSDENRSNRKLAIEIPINPSLSTQIKSVTTRLVSITHPTHVDQIKRAINVISNLLEQIRIEIISASALGFNIPSLIMEIFNAVIGTTLPTTLGTALANTLIDLFKSDLLTDEEVQEYNDFITILESETIMQEILQRIGSRGIDLQNYRVKVRVSRNPVLIKEDAYSLATIDVDHRTNEITIYVHQTFFDFLKEKSSSVQIVPILKALIEHELLEYFVVHKIDSQILDDYIAFLKKYNLQHNYENVHRFLTGVSTIQGHLIELANLAVDTYRIQKIIQKVRELINEGVWEQEYGENVVKALKNLCMSKSIGKLLIEELYGNIDSPNFPVIISQYVMEIPVRDETLQKIIEDLLNSEAGSETFQVALNKLFNYSKKFIPDSIFTIGKIETAYTEQELLREAIHKGIVVPIDKRLFLILKQAGILKDEDSEDLILIPVRDPSLYRYQKYAGTALHGRSIHTLPDEDGSFVIKGSGFPGNVFGSPSISLTFNLSDRFSGAMLHPSVVVNSNNARLLNLALQNIRQHDQSIPSDLFFKPVVSVVPIRIPVGIYDPYMVADLQEQYKGLDNGIYLLPPVEMVDFLTSYGFKEIEKFKDRLDMWRLYMYQLSVPWRFSEIPGNLEYFIDKLGYTPTQLAIEFSRRWGYILRILHKELGYIGTIVSPSGGISSILQRSNVGWCAFDYDTLLPIDSSNSSMIEKELEWIRGYIQEFCRFVYYYSMENGFSLQMSVEDLVRQSMDAFHVAYKGEGARSVFSRSFSSPLLYFVNPLEFTKLLSQGAIAVQNAFNRAGDVLVSMSQVEIENEEVKSTIEKIKKEGINIVIVGGEIALELPIYALATLTSDNRLIIHEMLIRDVLERGPPEGFRTISEYIEAIALHEKAEYLALNVPSSPEYKELTQFINLLITDLTLADKYGLSVIGRTPEVYHAFLRWEAENEKTDLIKREFAKKQVLLLEHIQRIKLRRDFTENAQLKGLADLIINSSADEFHLAEDLKKKDISTTEVRQAIRNAVNTGQIIGLDLASIRAISDIDTIFEGSLEEIATRLLQLFKYRGKQADIAKNKLVSYLAETDITLLKNKLKLLINVIQTSTQETLSTRKIAILLTEGDVFSTGDVLASCDMSKEIIYIHINLFDYIENNEEKDILRYILEYEDRELQRKYHEEDIPPLIFEKIKNLWRIILVCEDFMSLKKWLEERDKTVSMITVFGGARLQEGSKEYNAIVELGKEMAKEGFGVINGAGPGAMRASAEGVRQGNENLPREGITVRHFVYRFKDVPPEGLFTRYLISRFYSTRELGLFIGSIGAIAVPGGYGTLGEIFECIRQNIPLVLFGESYWKPIIDDIWEILKERGFIDERKFDHPFVTDDPHAAIQYLLEQKEKIEIGKRKVYYQTLPTDKHELIREIKETRTFLSTGPGRIVIVGGTNSTTDERETVQRVVSRLNSAGIVLRAGSRDALNLLLTTEGIDKENVEAVLMITKDDSPLTEEEKEIAAVTTEVGPIHRYSIISDALAYIFLPGNFGKLDVLFDILTKMQMGIIPKRPIILVGSAFWNRLLGKFLDSAIDKGLVKKEERGLLYFVDTPDEVIEIILKYQYDKSIDSKIKELTAVLARSIPPIGGRLAEISQNLATGEVTISQKIGAIKDRIQENIRKGLWEPHYGNVIMEMFNHLVYSRYVGDHVIDDIYEHIDSPDLHIMIRMYMTRLGSEEVSGKVTRPEAIGEELFLSTLSKNIYAFLKYQYDLLKGVSDLRVYSIYYREILKVLEAKYGSNSEVVRKFNELVSASDVSDLLIEAIYHFRNLPNIGEIIKNIYSGREAGAIGPSTELLHAYQLHKMGYKILAIGAKLKFGEDKVEIDIVATYNGQIYFFEVKSSLAFGYADKKLRSVENFTKASREAIREMISSYFLPCEETQNVLKILSSSPRLDRKLQKLLSPQGEITLFTLAGFGAQMYKIKNDPYGLNSTVIVRRKETIATGSHLPVTTHGQIEVSEDLLFIPRIRNLLGTFSLSVVSPLRHYRWMIENAGELYGKTFIHVSPGFKPTEDFLSAFSDPDMRIRVANAHQTGGLEPLVTEELVQITDMGMNAIGISLLYDRAPIQKEDGTIELVPVDYHDAIENRKLFYIGKILVPIYGVDEVVEVYAGIFESPKTKNNAVVLFLKHPEITREIYPSYDLREKQMLLLGRGTLAILKEIQGNPEFRKKLSELGLPFKEIAPAIVQLNEGMTVFAHPKTIVDRFTNDEFLNSLIYGFTTHTPVEAGLQKMPVGNTGRVGFNPEMWSYTVERNGEIDLTRICLAICDVVNAVSKEHAEITYSRLYPEFRNLIAGIVNGINISHWQISKFSNLVGASPSTENIRKMYEIHVEAKKRFANWIWQQIGEKLISLGENRENFIRSFEDNLVVVEARRKTNFKAVDSFIQAMMDPTLRDRFLTTNVVQVFLGKPHISDRWGQARVKELIALSEGRIVEVDENTLEERLIAVDPRLVGRIIFVPNLNVAEAPIIFQGADLLCMWSELTTEASATGYMKGLCNAIPTVATKTGGPLEHIKEEHNGFFVDKYQPNGRPTPDGIIETLERASLVHRRSIDDIKRGNFSIEVDWLRLMWNALQTTPEVDVEKVVRRYMAELWLPAYKLKQTHVNRTKYSIDTLLVQPRTTLACSVPIFSLRNSDVNYGIGKITDLVEVFRTMLKPAGVTAILLLPHFTPVDESPYAPVSTYAINELFIDWLKEAKRIKMPRKKIIQLRAKLESILGDRIDYTRLREVEFEVAKQVYEIFLSKKEKDFEEFCVQNSFWLENYARFMATYRLNGQYPTEIEQIEKAEKENPGVFETYVSLYKYMQYVAYMQLKETIEQIHMEGGRLIFDLPFFRAKNSCEVLFYPEYFDISKRSPYIWGQHWKDLILYNWDKLAEEEYNFLTSPIQHWLRVGFDGVRLDALHFSYPLTHLGHNIVQSGNEKGDDFVSKVVTSIRSVNPRAIIVAEAFEGVDVHLRRMYAIHTIACVDWYSEKDLNNISNNKIWLQISSHDSPRIQDNNTLVEKYGVEYNEESFKTFFNKVLTSGAEYVSFTIGDQWGESKRVKEEVNGETLWRYRIPLIAGRTFDITEFIGFITRNAMAKTEDGYFADGYVMGRSIEIEPQKAKDMLERLRTVSLQNFRLLYDYGKKELRDGNINAPHLHSLLVAYRWIKFMGQDGTWSLWHHSSQSDFFTKVYEILEQAGINEKDYPEIYSYLKQLNRKASAATSVLEKANINVQLFGFVQGFLENLLYREYVLTTKQEINPEFRDTFIKLLVAADSFIVKNKDGSLKIFAGYPWFVQSWGRDTFISLPGLLIVTGRYAEAKEVFRYYAKFQREDGLLPNIIHPDGRIEYNTADGSLWFVEALYRYYKATNDRKFIQEMLPVVNKIISLYTTKDRTGEIYMDDDYLVVVPAQWTWMDAAPNKNPVTPRNGKPVEIQALLYNALRISAEFNNMIGDKILAQEFEKIAEEIKMSIRLKYFEDNREYPFDVIDGDPHRDAVRPNALLLLSLSCVDDLLTDEQKQNIIEVVERELLTPFGLRTLSPKDDKYKGYYDTLAPGEIKDQAYHQGTVWPWLMREYILAKINQIRNKPAKEVRQHLITLVHNLCWLISKDCTLPEVFSGDAPHTPGGAVSQAWSIAAMLEIFDLINRYETKPVIDEKEIKTIFDVNTIRNLLGAG